MKQYKFTVVVNSPMNIKDILWAFTHKLKDAFPIVSISFDEVKEDKKDDELTHYKVNADGSKTDLSKDYNKIPERY